jgi:hypothetical protein
MDSPVQDQPDMASKKLSRNEVRYRRDDHGVPELELFRDRENQLQHERSRRANDERNAEAGSCVGLVEYEAEGCHSSQQDGGDREQPGQVAQDDPDVLVRDQPISRAFQLRIN